ncbi:LYR motif-containing protein 4-like [Dysidea avara]|uniref:LYR motif-containing protein 4-like n=1 Tax=Dysidea avara TaxID=196820 RepID=UPI00332E0846
MASVGVTVTRTQVLSLYRTMLREARQFTSFNYRSYAVRKIRDSFRANRSLDDVTAINVAYDEAITSLELLRRQVAINKLYGSVKQIVEQ